MTTRLVAQIHDRQITVVNNTSLGQCAPSATRARQPRASITDAPIKIGHRAGAFGRLAASTATAPNVTAKNVIVVDGKV